MNKISDYTELNASEPLKRILISSYDSDRGLMVRSLFERTAIDRGFKIVNDAPDIVASIGGDGNMLRTIRQYKHFGVPFVGINAGSLGFLPNFKSDEHSILKLFDMLETREYKVIMRPILDISMEDEEGCVYKDFAYNEFMIKYSNMKMMTIDIYIDGVKFNEYTGDGLAVSTPLGATGYAIWAGAAVVNPDLPCYQLTPINPNNSSINNPLLYSIVIPEKQKILFEVRNRDKVHVMASCDGNNVQSSFFKNIELSISDEKIGVIESCDYDYWAVLKSKILDKNL